MNLHRGGRRPLVIGHRGAAAIAPENTLASLTAAVDAGADLVEFDVIAGLTLAHSPAEVPDDPTSLDEALDLLRAHGAGIHLDMKDAGIEPEVIDALRRHGLAERAVVSSTFAGSLRRLAVAAPDVSRAIGYPRDRLGIGGIRWPGAVKTSAAASLRSVMPLRVPLLLRQARANVLSLQCRLVSPTVVSAAHARGAPVLAWTANDPETVLRLEACGVDAIVSDDPLMAVEALATLARL